MKTHQSLRNTAVFRRIRALPRDTRGVLIGIMALMFPVLLAFLGLAIDVGYILDLKRRQDKAAVAGAIGGAAELYRGKENSEAQTAAKADTKRNDFDDDDSGVTVTANAPPLNGPNQVNGFVEVIIENVAPTYFMRVINQEWVTVRSRAVAGLRSGADGCVYALNPTARAALVLNGGGGGPPGGGGGGGGGGQEGAMIASCGVVVNSSDDGALTLNGTGTHLEATEIGVVGGVHAPSNPPLLTPQPVTGIMPTLDPMAYMEEPSIPVACDFWDTVVDYSTPVTFTPGRYCANSVGNGPNTEYPASIQISGSADVTFAPGVYILDAGIQVTGNGTVTGTGVTFYSTNTLYPTELLAWNDFDFAGTAHIELTAPDETGTYPGVLLWVDPSVPADVSPGSVIAGDSTSLFVGAIYSPGGDVSWRGTNQTTQWTQIVADMVEISGNAFVQGGWETSPIPTAMRQIMLVE